MAYYVAGLCHWGTGALAPPFETVIIMADDDPDAVRQAIEWRLAKTLTTMLVRTTWLQVLRDGQSIYLEEIAKR